MCSIFALKMFRHLLAGSLICLTALTWSAQLQAAELTDLYQAQVDAGQSQAQWQLRRAIALEQVGKPVEAGRHYRQALQGQGLDESARRFAAERGAALGEP